MLNGEEQRALQKIVKNYFVKNPNSKKSEVVKHFLHERIARSTIYRYVDRELKDQALRENKNNSRPLRGLLRKKLDLIDR